MPFCHFSKICKSISWSKIKANTLLQITNNCKKIEYLNCPEYYENEINAYKSERITMPNVSAKYNQEREYMFWKNSILGNKSSTMYNHQK